MRSLVAQAVQAPEYNAKPALTCAYYTYWSGVAIEGAELYPRDRWMVIAFPTNDDLVCTFTEWPHEEFHSVRTDIEGAFWISSSSHPHSPGAYAAPSARRTSWARLSCPTSSASHTVLAGRWSETLAFTKTLTWLKGSPTLFAMPNS